MTAREDLIRQLNDEIEQLYPMLRTEGKHMGVFLHQAINIHADEGTLESIVEDVRKFLADARKRGIQPTPHP